MVNDVRSSVDRYVIRSLQTKRPLGVFTDPQLESTLPPGTDRVVFLGPNLLPPKFEIIKVRGEPHTYVFRVDNKNVADQDDRVFAFSKSTIQEYVVTYRDKQQASTIVKKGTNLAWSHPLEAQTTDATSGQSVHLFPLVESGEVPEYQLFRFELVPEDA